ncbi:MAG: hypothetical protein GF393_01835 [Armatimonadia bacterium]|nr:hypothetical protein [Armatimonadia bacterium]
MKHFLRPFEIPSAQVDRLEAVAQKCLDAARMQADDGTRIWQPDGAGKYPGRIYFRDFCYAVEGAGHLIPPEEIAAAIDYLIAGQREDGLQANCVYADGRVVYVVHGDEPPTDNAQFAVKLVDAYCDLTEDFEVFNRHANALMDGMETVPLSHDGLVEIDPTNPHSAYGFTDTVGKTGEVLFSSLLYWEACMLLAQLCQRVEDHDGAHIWFESAEHTSRALKEFFRERDGMMNAANGHCQQTDLWGSAYAGVVRALSKTETARVGEYLFDRYEECFLRGCVRHIPRTDHWQKMLAEYPRGTYQDGGYWPVATGWAAMVLDRYDNATAQMLIEDAIDLLEEEDAPEWINETEADGKLYVASAANVLAAVKRP